MFTKQGKKPNQLILFETILITCLYNTRNSFFFNYEKITLYSLTMSTPSIHWEMINLIKATTRSFNSI